MNEKSARKLQLSRRIDGIHPAAAWSIRVASIVFALIVGGPNPFRFLLYPRLLS